MVTKRKALDALHQQQYLVEIFDHEPERMDMLIDLALSGAHSAYRWQDYELLKKFVARFVGRDAVHPELRTAAHYEIILAFIDWLLPEMPVEEE